MHERLLVILLICVSILFSACGEGVPVGISAPGTDTPGSGNQPVTEPLTGVENFVIGEQNKSNSLSWDSKPGLSYTIYWSITPEISLTGGQRFDNATSPYSHINLENDTTYYYVIVSLRNNEKSPLSAVVSGTPSSLAALARPENFRVRVNNAKISLTWNKVPGADDYKVYWTFDTDEGVSEEFSAISPTGFFIHSDALRDLKYNYQVSALAVGGESERTEIKSITLSFALPGTPTNLETLSFTEKSVTIDWTGVDNVTDYIVFFALDNPDFDVVGANREVVKAGVTQFTLSGLKRGNVYYIKVVGSNEGGFGVPSEPLKIDFTGNTNIIDPSLFAPKKIEISVDGLIALLRWKTLNTRYNYTVYYATEPGVTKANYTTKENGANSKLLGQLNYRMDNLKIGRTYYVIVISTLGDKESVASEEISFLVNIPDAHFEQASISNGAKLYGQWWKQLSNAPTTENDIWQDAAKDSQGNIISKIETADTWRCSSCHGWDYLGKDGEYGVGSENYTNFPGLRDAVVNMSKEDIFAFIRHGTTSLGRAHQFSTTILDVDDTLDLTRFIINEIPKDLNVWQGIASRGESVFTEKNSLGNACGDRGCHKDLPNLNTEKQNLLASALAQPARFIHYARFGVGRMPGGQSLNNAENVLAYLWQQSVTSLTSNFQQIEFDKTGEEFYDQWALGGMLYDRWWDTIAAQKNPRPTGNHPLWPSTSTVVNGSDTWRCKECHGWDYRGKDGAYGSGKHFTGITGIIGADTTRNAAKDVYDYLRSGDRASDQHAYGQFLTDKEIYALTRFVVEIRNEAATQQAPRDLLDGTKQQPLEFSTRLGESLYQDAVAFGGCINCHSVDDFQWFFNDNDPERGELQTLDSIAKNNPWEFIHKTRYGQPNSNMKGIVQYGSIIPDAAIDILGYVQTALAPDLKRGARLYDAWWLENDLARPIVPHVLWPTDSIGLRAEETWRCVACHGWDYQGVQGIKGLLQNTQDVPSYIESGTVLVDGDHAFSAELKRQDISDLSEFVRSKNKTGVRDDIDLLIANADPNEGSQHYTSETPGNCVNCHGESGTSIPNIDLETSANNFAQRFIHRARFGSPATIMVPSLNRYKGLTAVQAADVQAFATTIATSTVTNRAGLDRGGRLFDNWFREMRASDDTIKDPTLVNPLWELRSNGIPELSSLSDSWRCVSCHNWNYKGIDLLSGDTDADNLLIRLQSRLDRFPNQSELEAGIYEWIKNGTGNLHNYGSIGSQLPSILGDRELKELSVFIAAGMINTSEYIYNIDGSVINGNVINGRALYTGVLLPDINCSNCHGDTGESIPPGGSGSVDIFALAKKNPWQFLHVVRFASSGTNMPALVGLPGTNLQHALDVLSFAQAEFAKRP